MSPNCDAPECPFGGEAVPRGKWHLKREVGVDVIIAFIALLGAGIGYVMHQETRVTKVEERTGTLEDSDKRLEASLKSQKEDLVKKVDRIEDKLDRALERRSR